MDWSGLRAVVNWVNLSTPLGLAIARVGGAQLSRGPRRLYLAGGYRIGFPVASAFTVGSVVVSRHDAGWLNDHPALLAHEERHSCQYAACGGLLFLPVYAVAAACSWLTTGDVATANLFERLAGLSDGGYRVRSVSTSPSTH